MKFRLSLFVLTCALALSGCAAREGEAIPVEAATNPDGSRWVLLQPGSGGAAAGAEFWSVAWTDYPCESNCDHLYSGRRQIEVFDQFRANLVTMREGESRRVWVPLTRGGFALYELRLERAFKAGPDGEPVITNT